mmetsp:Transcript_92828/g.276943  ORF Transcript_92828/g.276943 Transcript_92828/m.276943 type:complete len:258 (-) Transcript_92828:1919-2692(-)
MVPPVQTWSANCTTRWVAPVANLGASLARHLVGDEARLGPAGVTAGRAPAAESLLPPLAAGGAPRCPATASRARRGCSKMPSPGLASGGTDWERRAAPNAGVCGNGAECRKVFRTTSARQRSLGEGASHRGMSSACVGATSSTSLSPAEVPASFGRDCERTAAPSGVDGGSLAWMKVFLTKLLGHPWAAPSQISRASGVKPPPAAPVRNACVLRSGEGMASTKRAPSQRPGLPLGPSFQPPAGLLSGDVLAGKQGVS